jgi:molybdate transport system substrate-binding protein
VRQLRPAALILAALALTACSGSGSAADSASGSVATPSRSGSDPAVGTVTVFAASSLKEAFTTLGAQFEALHPQAKVTFNFGASSTLATQIAQGGPADVFASASTTTMATVVAAGVAPAPHNLATNVLEIATPTKATVPVTGLADLAKPGVKVAVCQQDAPCGAAAVTLFDKNKLTVTPVSEEVDVKSVLSKVVLGEVDAGIVYVTDVKAAKDTVVGVEIPAADNVSTTYQIAAISTGHTGVAGEFVDYVLSPEGQKVLAAAGFSGP